MTTTKGVSWADLGALGVSYRQLDYWIRFGYIEAENPTPGSGRRRVVAPEELLVAERMARLVAGGMAVAVAAIVARQPDEHVEIARGVTVRVSEAKP